MSGVRRTKVRDARECLSVLRIKLTKKKYKKEKVTKRKHSFSNSGGKKPNHWHENICYISFRIQKKTRADNKCR